MKTGIVTYHRARNYGAVLQAYALSEFLNRNSIKCDVIDYKCDKIENGYKLKKMRDLKSVKDIIRFFTTERYVAKKQKKYEDFRKQFCNLSNVEYDSHNIKSANKEYDSFITGSDQVWNYKGSDFDKTYFLDFAEQGKSKNSYAASFGLSEIPDELKGEYNKLLGSFNNVSVREEQGCKLFKDITGKDAKVLIDPVFLIPGNEWAKVAVCPEADRYIFVYAFSLTQEMKAVIKKIAKLENMKIVVINDSVKSLIPGAKSQKAAGPREFVGLLYGAEYVVTDSFHGTAFSILFNKKFFVAITKEKVSSRIYNLLSLFGLEDRVLKKDSLVNIKENIDFDPVNRKIFEEREKATEFLKSVVEK